MSANRTPGVPLLIGLYVSSWWTRQAAVWASRLHGQYKPMQAGRPHHGLLRRVLLELQQQVVRDLIEEDLLDEEFDLLVLRHLVLVNRRIERGRIQRVRHDFLLARVKKGGN